MLSGTTYQHDPRPLFPFEVLGRQYPNERSLSGRFTLVLMHGISVHKETWEPVLQELFSIKGTKDGQNLVKEAWSIECPNHGESAAVNNENLTNFEKTNDACASSCYRTEDTPMADPSPVSGDIYPEAVHRFISSRPGGMDLLQRELVFLGHSMGGIALVSSAVLSTLEPKLPIAGTIFMDATISRERQDNFIAMLTFFSYIKTDVWASRDAARASLSKIPTFKHWDPRALDLFVATYRGVCHFSSAFKAMARLQAETSRVHFIFSSIDEYGLDDLRKDQVDGVKPEGVQWVPRAGHMFLQTEPKETALAIQSALYGIAVTLSRNGKARILRTSIFALKRARDMTYKFRGPLLECDTAVIWEFDKFELEHQPGHNDIDEDEVDAKDSAGRQFPKETTRLEERTSIRRRNKESVE
ncbi:Alpha/beta hydrolase family-domain-containing protein [Vararia minispora EC-137]|uniref:Alpha/beta hydrolase family-domain-containing protein n=1 Tax=Vararia minispora EC-137 TaxID=1314806 RepID=A0ACB8QJ82_9AGAM|nr:Alpha/beta hydrolase family-domain-containing protein [Vararia minispora EC-137]